MIEFENPFAFFLLLFIPVLYFFRHLKIFGRHALPLTLSNWNGTHFEYDARFRKFISALNRILLLATFVCLVISYANPVIHNQKRVYSSRGSDIVFVLDSSPSMMAKDMDGETRLSAAKKVIKKLSADKEGMRLGLVEMAQDSSMVVPLTLDHGHFFECLESITAGNMGDGTSIGTGLTTALFHLKKSTSPNKCVILITDGENNAGLIHPDTAAQMLEKNAINFYLIGIGTKGAVPLDYVDPKTGKNYSGFLESSYDSSALISLALKGNGKFMEVKTIAELSLALESISSHEAVPQSYTVKTYDVSYAGDFLLAAIILFAFAWIFRRIFLQEVL